MGEVNLDQVEVTLLTRGKRHVKRFNGDFAEAITLNKFARITLSDGTEYFAELRLVPNDLFPFSVNADQLVYENFFIEAHDVLSDGKGNVVHEKRGHI
jgi:hypothetical protein